MQVLLYSLNRKYLHLKIIHITHKKDLSTHRIFGVPQGAFYDKAELECALGDYPYIRPYG